MAKPWQTDDAVCSLSWLTPHGCHHCRTNAPNLGNVRELIGFDDDAPTAA